MNVRLIEGNLLFEFGSRWTNVFHWDRHADFLAGMKKAHKGKAVDFVAVFDDRIPYLFEVKDYRTFPRAPEKMKIENEFELKVRSTVAALFGTRFDNNDSCRSFESFRISRQPRVVLWHEDFVSNHAELVVMREKIARNLSWLRSDPFVTNTRFTPAIPDLVVHPLPGVRQERINEVIAMLESRDKTVPQELRWRIEAVLEVSDLDHLLDRAKTVRHGWNLFR